MRTPKLQQAVTDMFPDAELLSGIPPDEVIATGLAREAHIMAEQPCDIDIKKLSVDVSAVSKSIFLKVRHSVL